MKLFAFAVVVLVMVTGCVREPQGQEAAGEDVESAMPRSASHPKTLRIGAVCELETINRLAPREKPVLRAGSPAVFRGSAMVADAEAPVPPLVHVVLRRIQGGNFEDIYLEMGRMPRPDLALGDSKRELAGFEGERTLPMPGTYDVLVSSGAADWQTLCRTGSSLQIVE